LSSLVRRVLAVALLLAGIVFAAGSLSIQQVQTQLRRVIPLEFWLPLAVLSLGMFIWLYRSEG